jgi:hypothetical protein
MRAVPLVLVALIAACSSATRRTDRDRSLIRADEIATVHAANAYDIVAKLRADFLRTRGPITTTRGRATTPPVITVFVDGIEAGPVDATLHHIPANSVHEIRLYRAADAATKYGSRHNGGVIEVVTNKPRS